MNTMKEIVANERFYKEIKEVEDAVAASTI